MKTTLKTVIALFVMFSFCMAKSNDPAKGKRHSGTNPRERQKDEKVLICHVPPGNSGNGQSIWVSPNAVSAHLAHGDFLGSCDGPPVSCQEQCLIDYLDCLANGGTLCEFKACMVVCGEGGPAPTPAPTPGK